MYPHQPQSSSPKSSSATLDQVEMPIAENLSDNYSSPPKNKNKAKLLFTVWASNSPFYIRYSHATFQHQTLLKKLSILF